MAESSSANATVSSLKVILNRPKSPELIPIPHNLSFISSTDDFEIWWTMWKTHAFRRALGPLLKQLDAEADTSAKTDETSSGDVEEVLMPSTTLEVTTSKGDIDQVATLAKPQAETPQPIASSSAVPMVIGEAVISRACLSFDPESIEPAHSTTRDEPSPNVIADQLQRLKALLSSPIETLVENSEEVKNILEEVQPHVPVMLQLKLWPVVTLSAFTSRTNVNGLTRKRQFGCQDDTSVSTAELEILRKELKDLEEKVRVTKELICDKEASIARSQREAEGLKAELKTDLAEIRALNKQLVTGKTRMMRPKSPRWIVSVLPLSMLLMHSFSRAFPCDLITAHSSLYLCL
ncbi:hypothetical protein QYE76_001310 [Lolium multiflorum]|uniref:Uncharacterized protein n=1 Tax=Lolium multiflorum TaxID=4521 RepID=A0AAD8RLL2_LOLMU|nr:hypothetical protein QYE76_001310 [Lolium multiflorum]